MRPGIVVCNLRGNLKKNLTYNISQSVSRKVIKAKRGHTYDTVSIGDRVMFTPAEDGTGIIEQVKPRASEFTRAGFRGMVQTMVSNLDQLVVVFACAEPNPDLWRIDKWLAAAEAGGLKVLLVANKCELVDDPYHFWPG